VSFLHLAVFHDKGVPLAARLAKDCSTIKCQVERIRESCVRICEEANLMFM
jgi:hypothetical protein